MPRRFLIAPDKFKGSLSAPEAAAAIAAGILRREPDAVIDLCPIADGGEGFMKTMATALRGRMIPCPAVDPLGREISSNYVIAETQAGRIAILEMAETAGLWRLREDERDPRLTTTRGVGMQIVHAISNHAVTRIIIGLGGSATNDGGAGMAAELGVDFRDERDDPVDPTPSNFSTITSVGTSSRIVLPEIIAACDVDNPLLGERGATAVFSTQKGATPESMPSLESTLTHLVSITNAADAALTPGAGAAGGLGFGLLHFTAAKLIPGFDLLADLLNLKLRIKNADLVITGEGSLDSQSLSGKGPVALARLANRLSVPVVGVCGIAHQDARDSGIFTSIHALADTGLPTETLLAQAGSLLSEMVANTDF